MAGQFAISTETIFKQAAAGAGLGDQLIDAVAQIAPGNALLTLPESTGGAAVVAGGDDPGQSSADPLQGRKQMPRAMAATQGNNSLISV